VGRLSFRVQQLNVRVETKTLDNVFLNAVVSVQYQVLRDKVFEAFYSLTNPGESTHCQLVKRTRFLSFFGRSPYREIMETTD
jgi:hypothetical protein